MNQSAASMVTLLAVCFLAIRNEATPPSGDTQNDPQYAFQILQNAWRREFSQRGEKYIDARMTLYRGHVDSACGSLLAPGAYYCPLDRTLYFDLAASAMQLHVIAHELGHHVQSLRGQTFSMQQLELHADCLAGIGVSLVGTTNQPALADIESAMRALHADTAHTHGTAGQRLTALHRGQESGSLRACDGFVTRR